MWVRGGRLRIRFCYPLEPLPSEPLISLFIWTQWISSQHLGRSCVGSAVSDRHEEKGWMLLGYTIWYVGFYKTAAARQEANWVGFLILPLLCLPRWSSVEPSRTTVLAIFLQKQAWLQGSTQNINDLLWYGWEKHGCITLWTWIPANVMKFP